MSEKQAEWDWEIKTQTTWLGASYKELYAYKDLMFRLVRKDFLTSYQQTLLGPLWVLLQPILTVIIYVLVFYKMLGGKTDGVPPFLYYLIGITLWNLFSDVFINTASTFSQNARIFSKVYFPRIIVPISVMVVHSTRFLIQLLLLVIVLFYYFFMGDVKLHIGGALWALPAVIFTAMIGLGAGLIFSILTAKYRDLLSMVNLMMRLLMFVCPIFYSVQNVNQKYKWLVYLNPLSSPFELFRYSFIGTGEVSLIHLAYSALTTVVLVAAGVLFFNKMGDKLIDVI
ncbi:MAG: ABC transporter permease [Chitinophagaceae bacterium]